MNTRSFIPFLFLLCSCHNNNKAPVVINTDVPVEKIMATKDQQERRNQSEAICKEHKVPFYKNPTAMFMDSEEEVTLRTKDEVVDRALALCYTGLKSEGLEKMYLDKMDGAYHIMQKLTPEEKAYALAAFPTEQQTTDANWHYESMHVMLWALGFIDSLNYPSEVCVVAEDSKIIHDLSETQFRQKAKLRSKKEILDQADLILRLDWACAEARIGNNPIPGKLNTDVVTERHRSLNWLINYMQQAWDDVSNDT